MDLPSPGGFNVWIQYACLVLSDCYLLSGRQAKKSYHNFIANNFQGIKILWSSRTGFLHWFICKMTLDIDESWKNYNNAMIIGGTINNVNWWCMKCARFYFHNDIFSYKIHKNVVPQKILTIQYQTTP